MEFVTFAYRSFQSAYQRFGGIRSQTWREENPHRDAERYPEAGRVAITRPVFWRGERPANGRKRGKFRIKPRYLCRINAIIEKGSDGLYAVRTDFKIGRSFPGSFGESVEEAKEDFEAAIEDAIGDARANGFKSPDKEALRVVYKYDIPSFFNYFDFINVAKFAALVGINESKLRQYKSGIAYPGEKTTKKILSTVERIGSELANARL